MRIVADPSGLPEAIEGARGAKSAFGDETVFLEQYLEAPRHIEIQVLGDGHGRAVVPSSSGSAPSNGGIRRSSRRRRHRPSTIACAGAWVTPPWPLPGGRVCRSGDCRVPLPGRRVLLPGDEHETSGGAPGDRDGDRIGPGAAPDRDRRWRPDRSRAHDLGTRHRNPAVRRGSRKDFLPVTGTIQRFDVPDLPV